MSKVIIFFALAGFFIWYIQSQKIFDFVFIGKFLKELRKCSICLGFWVCLVFAFVFDVNILDFQNFNEVIYIWGYVLTAAVSGFILHLIFAGYKALYTITVLE